MCTQDILFLTHAFLDAAVPPPKLPAISSDYFLGTSALYDILVNKNTCPEKYSIGQPASASAF